MILRLSVQREANATARHIDAEHRPSSRQQQRSIRAAAAICAYTDHTSAVGGGHNGSFLISHQQNASQGKASRGALSIRSLHTNKRSKGIRPAAGGSLLHLLSRRQRGQAYRRGLNR